MRTANKDADKSQLNQYLLKYLLTFLHNAAMLAWCFAARKLHARLQPDSGRCTERQLWRDITSHQSCWTHKRPLSVTRCLLPAMTLVNDNSDDEPRHLPLYVNNLGSCLSYEPRGIASVTGYWNTVNGISGSSGSLTIVYGSDEICRCRARCRQGRQTRR